MRGLYTLLAQASLLSSTLGANHAPQNAVKTKTLHTRDGYTYTYDYVPAHNASMSTFLLLHGYPSSRSDWSHQVSALSSAGYGVIAPDLLGFGATSKPTDLEAYRLKAISGHLAEILDKEEVDKAVGVGHDWGSGVLSRLVVWYPERFSKLVFMSVGYAVPGELFDVDAINAAGLEELDYTPFGYWYFFNSYDSAGIIAERLESFYHLIYHTNTSAWGQDFTQISAARAWLSSNKTTPLPPWLTPSHKSSWLSTYSQPNIVAATLNYYRGLLRGVQVEDEAGLTDEEKTIKVPVLAIGGAEDQASRSDFIELGTEPWAKGGFEFKVIEAGHWVMFEKPEEINRLLIDFGHH